MKLPRRVLEVRVPVWNCRARPVKCRAPIRKCRARVLFCRVLPRCLVSRFLARWGCLPRSRRLAFVERVLPRCLGSRFLIRPGYLPRLPRFAAIHAFALFILWGCLPRSPPRPPIRASLGPARFTRVANATPSPPSPPSAAEPAFANRHALQQPTAPPRVPLSSVVVSRKRPHRGERFSPSGENSRSREA